jgi:hypothetical protein
LAIADGNVGWLFGLGNSTKEIANPSSRNRSCGRQIGEKYFKFLMREFSIHSSLIGYFKLGPGKTGLILARLDEPARTNAK